MDPIIGRTVLYRLTETDANEINRRRSDAAAYRAANPTDRAAGEPGRTGHVVHIGNHAEEGQEFPATVVRTFGGSAANLQVALDGTDTHWVTSRSEGTAPGTWSWPARTDS